MNLQGSKPLTKLSIFGFLALALSVLVSLVHPTTAFAVTPQTRIDLRVLVVTNRDSSVEAIRNQLDLEGVPNTVVDTTQAGRQIIDAAYLSDVISTGPRAKFQAVVLPNDSTLTAPEMTALAQYETAFGIRQVLAYSWASPAVGLNYAGYSGTLDGIQANLVAGARSGGNAAFRYLDASVGFDNLSPTVSESYGYVATPQTFADGTGQLFTPFITTAIPGTDQQGSLIGQYSHDGREDLVITFAYNRAQRQSRLLGHGIITWMTKGVHLGYTRNYFSVHVDDVFLPDARWSASRNCTPGSDCVVQSTDAAAIRMTSADVSALSAWQSANAMKLDLAFNAAGSVEAIENNNGAADGLTTALVKKRASFRWLNHTYSHEYLGCVQNWAVLPWQCVNTATGATKWVSVKTIENEITTNLTWAAANGISVPSNLLVSGEHSGLKSLPQMPKDNPNFVSTLGRLGIAATGSDSSRESSSRLLANGVTVTVPRYPMNVYYNVGTYFDEVDEYNWIYTSRANGGSGLCEDNPTTSTCVVPIPTSQAGFFDRIVPAEAAIAFSHVLGNDPRPHYAHQSNLTQDRLLYPVVNDVLAQYRAEFSTNCRLINPTMQQSADVISLQQTWAAALTENRVSAYLLGGKVKIQVTGAALRVPVTLPSGSTTSAGLGFGASYGGEQSAWTTSTMLNPAVF